MLKPDISSLMRRIEDGTMFMLYGVRGSGKTTAALFALEEARRRGYVCVSVDCGTLQSCATASELWESIALRVDLELRLQAPGIQLPRVRSLSEFQHALSRSSLGDHVRLVLMLDEFDFVHAMPVDIKTNVSCCAAVPTQCATVERCV